MYVKADTITVRKHFRYSLKLEVTFYNLLYIKPFEFNLQFVKYNHYKLLKVILYLLFFSLVESRYKHIFNYMRCYLNLLKFLNLSNLGNLPYNDLLYFSKLAVKRPWSKVKNSFLQYYNGDSPQFCYRKALIYKIPSFVT